MAQFVDSQGRWWQQRPDGTWLRWDDIAQRWEEAGPPPPDVLSPPPSPPPVTAAATPSPPGAPGPAPPPYPWAAAPYRDLRTPARWTIGLLVVAAVVAVAAAASSAVAVSKLREIPDREFERLVLEAPEEIDIRDTWQEIAGAGHIAIVLATAIPFLIWFRRAYDNLAAFGARNLRYGPGWATGAWFVPVLRLWRPKQVMNDIWRASNPRAPAEQGESWRNGEPPPRLLQWWWATWLVGAAVWWLEGGFVVGFLIGATSRSAIGISDAILIAQTISNAITAVCALLAIRVILVVTSRQEERARAFGPSSAP